MTIGPVLASEDKLDKTKLTHLAKNCIEAAGCQSDGIRQWETSQWGYGNFPTGNKPMEFFLARVVRFLCRTFSKPQKAP